ncbi:hypothetical protein TEA_014833 [Camellia sinensis var. sinensis]|uniref:Uncharacterized protein n=1 Tax=Camellia sinensis var. sinensis TaxID=542762 RepID=A0A4S4EF43_CAMSN|nr:hypothetical protein TEA_014833 [Camellia sinensis var. sinensis]
MVGIFSRFSVNRNIHRRTQSTIDEREVLSPNSEAPDAATVITGAALAAAHGIEVAVEFKPLEHPTEPLDNDRSILCPLPEPSILNDGRIWKERVSAGTGVRRRADLPVMQEGTPMESESVGPKPRRPSNRMILPSISAPEHNILQLLEECNASASSVFQSEALAVHKACLMSNQVANASSGVCLCHSEAQGLLDWFCRQINKF